MLAKAFGFAGIFLTIARGSSNPSLLEGFGGRRIYPLPEDGAYELSVELVEAVPLD